MYFRYYLQKIDSFCKPGRVLVIYGPRRVGKTYLLEQYLRSYPGKTFIGVGEDRYVREVLGSESVQSIRSAFSGYDLVVIDEAQKIENVGVGLKLLVDHLPETKVIGTGSSSFDLAQKVGEPLTGRKITLRLYPLAVLEIAEQYGPMRVNQLLDQLLVYGSYPEVLSQAANKDKIRFLGELRDSYLYKDILELENLRNSSKLIDLLTLLAFQIGQEVSLSELGSNLNLSKQTVERYLDLLEKAFVIVKVRGFSRNLRKEVSKTSRYYFFDNGVRNAVINNFNPLSQRNDIGQLWENFVFVERAKKREYHEIACANYFWRTYDQQEIDLVEERGGALFGYECKYSAKKATKPPNAWTSAYPEAEFETISCNNFLGFVS